VEARTVAELQHGATLAGYRIEALIGHGPAGPVYAAEDLERKRRVALRVLPPGHDLRAVRAAAALQHPHIVPIYDAGEIDGVAYLAMRLMGDGSLADLLQRSGRLEPERALRICEPVAAALDAAHAAGIVHGAVTPRNVLLDGDDAILSGFGLAARDDAYLAPEQLDGQPAEARTDVYALGCVLFECLGDTPALDAVIARALAKEPADRYATCGELIRDARRVLRGAPAPHTFVFADMRGYTTYTRVHGDEASALLVEQFTDIVEPLAPRHGGTMPQFRGDEALVVFESPRNALRYALELQARVRAAGLPVGVGVGIDTGEAVAIRDDFHGGALNRAARLCAKAKAGEVLASDAVLHLAGQTDGVRFGLRRLERLKGFEQPVGVNEVHPADTAPRRDLGRRMVRAVRGTRPRVRLVAAIAVLAAVSVGALAVLRDGGPTGATATGFAANSIALLNARTGKPLGTAAPGLQICMFATAGKDLWACDADQSILLQVDARERRVVNRVPLPTYHGSFTIGFDSIWVGDIATPTVRKVSPRFRTSSPPIRLAAGPAISASGITQGVDSMVATKHGVWAAYGFPKRIAHIDPETSKVTVRRPLRQDCPCSASLAAAGDQLWAVGGDGRRVYRLDSTTGRTMATGRLHQGSVTGAAVAGGYLWVAIEDDGAVWKIDPSGSSVDKVATGAGPSSVAAADGYVWVANADAGTVTRIDPSTNATRRYRVGHRPLAVAEAGGTLFVGLGQSPAEASAGLAGPKVVRGFAPDFANSTDTTMVGSPVDLLIGRATGAGLMFADTDARGATDIVPELAAAAPAVSADGRTYTFRLRPGLRFSSNEPVTADAVKQSIERAVAPILVNHYCRDFVLGDVAGEAAYEAGRADGISGIRANGDSVTITLVRRSSTLPARVSNPCLNVDPAGTPTLPVGLSHPIPSAGPYYAASLIFGEQVVLRRNPHYAGPRPARLDALVLRAGVAANQAAAAVERGRADYVADAGAPPSPEFMPGGRYEREYGRPGGRLRFVRTPSDGARIVFFNTRRGIFRSAALRRAANLALDRAALARGAPVAPRTRLIPPGMPGYRATQVYPLHPDLRRARALAAGRGGSAVLAVQAGGPERDPSAGEIRTDLAKIGVRVIVRPVADPSAVAAGVDMVMTAWGPDYADPFSVVNVLLDPAARAPAMPDYFDDPVWVRRLRAAAAAPLARRDAVYARLDADLARGPAPLMVLGSLAGTPQLYSARLGCEHYAYGRLDLATLCAR
jgi:ABC-type transport system substrate-binding protein/class 3 adenylate cyclase